MEGQGQGQGDPEGGTGSASQVPVVPAEDVEVEDKPFQNESGTGMPTFEGSESAISPGDKSSPDLQSSTSNPPIPIPEESSTVFHCVSYLGAAGVQSPRSEAEIHKTISFLNSQPIDQLIQVSVSVPLYSDGTVVISEDSPSPSPTGRGPEICRFTISQIIFFARGPTGTIDEPCFAFTCSHGDSLEEVVFQCHVFRCDVKEAVGRVFGTFARAFQSTSPAPGPSDSGKIVEEASTGSPRSDNLESLTTAVFQVTLEFKEEDGKGSYTPVPREKSYFKLRSNVPKQINLTIQQLPSISNNTPELIVERCFGLLLSPGRHVLASDMQLVEMLSWSIGSSGPGADSSHSYVVTGAWDINDPSLQGLNSETAKDEVVFLTVAVDLVVKGIREPIRFALETQAKIYSPTERFWMIVRKYHYTQQFLLTLRKEAGDSQFQLISNTLQGEVERGKLSFNLNFTSFISSRAGSIVPGDDITTPNGGGGGLDENDEDDDEPLQSGMGQLDKDCSDEQLVEWGNVLGQWSAAYGTKAFSSLVRTGIPETMRGEVWARLSANYFTTKKSSPQKDTETISPNPSSPPIESLMESYRTLITKDYSGNEIIIRDISRTFPGNHYFRDSGSGQELLYKISKAYALYDTEIGYCQGISFIAAALLLQMPEEQSFCLLVKIMYDYSFRDLYRDGFDNLRLKLYQLDRLIEDQLPELWTHFNELGIESHMYASQWFLTLFTAKFPLGFVFRVIDIFLLDGTKILFQIAVALLMSSRKDFLMLDFEGILKYFRVSLPKKYRSVDATNSLIRLSSSIKTKKLKRYAADYQQMKERSLDPLDVLRKENKKLIEDQLRFEQMIGNLVQSKCDTEEKCQGIEDEYIKLKVSVKELEEFNLKLKEENKSVKELFQRELKTYDSEAEKKTNIIAGYKKICSDLSSQLESELKNSRERMEFFHSNLCPACSTFVSTALQIANNRSSPAASQNGEIASSRASFAPLSPLPPDLESELAKTKIALAEAECRNEDLSHRLSQAFAELELLKSHSSKEKEGSSSSGYKIWKNLTGSGGGSSGSNRKSMSMSLSSSGFEETSGSGGSGSGGTGANNNGISGSVSLQSLKK